MGFKRRGVMAIPGQNGVGDLLGVWFGVSGLAYLTCRVAEGYVSLHKGGLGRGLASVLFCEQWKPALYITYLLTLTK